MLNKFTSGTKKINKVIAKINPNNLANTDLTGSLSNIQIPTTNKFNSKSKSSKIVSVVNNKTIIKDFHKEILEHSAMYVKVKIDEFDNNLNTLTIKNMNTDYGTEGASSQNFEILVFGLHIPGDYTVNDNNDNVVITLGDRYIDFDNTTINDIYVIGKLRYLNLNTEGTFDITTEDGEEIIV